MHQIKALSSIEYVKPEPINFGDLKIDENLIAEKSFTIKEKITKKDNVKDFNNLQFTIN